MAGSSPTVRIVGAAILVALIAGAYVVVGGHGPVPTSTPRSTLPLVPTPGSTRPAATKGDPTRAPGASFAPFGYAGSGTIEFTRHTADEHDSLWVIDPSGANERLVLDGACCGLFSPDGAQLALAAPGITPLSIPRDPGLLGVEIVDATGSIVSVVPSNCAACAVLAGNYEPDAWSPNGRFIGLSMWSDTDPGHVGLGIADRDYPDPWGWAKLSSTGSYPDVPIAFSPDSTRLLFFRTTSTSGPTAMGELFLYDLANESVRQLSPTGLTLLANGLIQGPAAWSPDGKQIIFAARDAAGTSSIYAVGAGRGASVRTILQDAPGVTSARYSPDGSTIVFDQAGPRGLHDLYVMGPNGEHPTNLTSNLEPGVCCAQWAPDGRAVVVTGTPTDDTHYDLYIVAVDGSGIWQLTNQPNVYTGFLWGPGFR